MLKAALWSASMAVAAVGGWLMPALALVPARGTFYALRHSYIPRMIEEGVAQIHSAESCGTNVHMRETTHAKMLAGN